MLLRQITIYSALTLLPLGAQSLPSSGSVPSAFETRTTGKTTSGEASSIRKEKSTTRKVSYVAVTELRNWRNTGGVTIRARMLAFDVGEPANTKKTLTLVRDGKIRLLVDGKKQYNDLPLAKLSPEDQQFVKNLQQARRQTAEKEKPVPTAK